MFLYNVAQVREGSCSSRPLPYGEVRMRPGDVAIGWESVPHASPSIGRLYEQAVTASRLDPATVLVVRMTEMQVAVDYVDFQDPSWPV